LKRLVAFDAKPFTASTGNQRMLWNTSDSFKAVLENQPVNVWLDVEPDITIGVAIRILDTNGTFGLPVPLYSGMCKAKLTATEKAKWE
jgi:hypothetical protein